MHTMTTAIASSAEQFTTVVWPAVAPLFGPGRLEAVETVPDALARLLDFAGIDHVFVPADGGEAVSLASRVSRTRFETITLSVTQRARLEAAAAAPVAGRLGPAVYIHGYVDSIAGLLHHAFVATADALAAALDQAEEVYFGNRKFWAVDHRRVTGCRRVPDPQINPFLR